MWIEYIGHLPFEYLVVAAGILAVIAQHQLHPPDLRKLFFQRFQIRQEGGGYGVRKEQLFFLRKGGQLPGLLRLCTEGLLTDHMLSRQKRFFRLFIMQQVRRRDIDRVHLLVPQECIQVGIDPFCPIFCRKLSSLFLRPGVDRSQTDTVY